MSRKSMVAAFTTIAALSLGGCFEHKEVWIVVNLEAQDGTPGQMSFRNPSVHDVSLGECEQALPDATQTLMRGIASEPETSKYHFVSAKCVESDDDPLKPGGITKDRYVIFGGS